MPLSTANEFRAQRALLHPVWWAALSLLVLNDHVFKGAGLLPPALTGKLSDFAGLLVAPLLLASLGRVRGVWGWSVAHLAVGLVFSAIQLSPVAARAWSGAMGLVGMPWAITSDPWDLLALPMLGISFWLYPSAMQQRPGTLARSTAQWSAAGIGLLCCVATSRAETGWMFQDIVGDVYVHNPTEADLVLRIRELDPAVDFDCDEIARDPGRLLTEPLFGPASSWTLAPDANQVVVDHLAGERKCYAALLDADNLAPVVVFWRDGSPGYRTIAGQGIDASAPGWISIDYDTDGRGFHETELDLVYAPTATVQPSEGRCEVPPESHRLEWSEPVPEGVQRLRDVVEGPDGCLAIELGPENEEVPGDRWYLCMPASMFPFAAGDVFEATASWVGGGGTMLRIAGTRATEEASAEYTELSLASGPPELVRQIGMEAVFIPDFTCEPHVDPTCGTVGRSGSVVVSGGGSSTVRLWPGETASLVADHAGQLEIYLRRAQDRVALHPGCDLGTDTLGPEIEYVTRYHEAAE